MENLQDIANKMVSKGKGILAADESTPTCTSRFESIGVESTFETRNEYRDMLMGADGLVLAAETAIGKYPIEAVQMINSLVKQFKRWTPESSIRDIIFDWLDYVRLKKET